MRKEDNAAWFFTHDNPNAPDTDRADEITRLAMKTAVEVPLFNILDTAGEKKDLNLGSDAANGIKAEFVRDMKDLHHFARVLTLRRTLTHNLFMRTSNVGRV